MGIISLRYRSSKERSFHVLPLLYEGKSNRSDENDLYLLGSCCQNEVVLTTFNNNVLEYRVSNTNYLSNTY